MLLFAAMLGLVAIYLVRTKKPVLDKFFYERERREQMLRSRPPRKIE